MELVSIVVPVYNTERYIEKTIHSILNQTYSNIEVIIVDDGGTDKAVQIADSTLAQRNHIVIHESNAGLSTARNTGLAKAQGKYVCFVDSDDCIAPNHIEWLVLCAEKNGLNICYSGFEPTSEAKREGSTCRFEPEQVFDGEIARQKFALRKIQIHACALLMNVEFLRKNELTFNPNLRFGEDAEFIWRALFATDRIGSVQQKTYKYLTREGSLMTSPSLEKAGAFSAEFKKSLQRIRDNYPEQETFLSEVYDRVMFGLYRSYAMFATDEEWREMIRFFPTTEIAKRLFHSKDWRVAILAQVLCYHPTAFRKVTQLSVRM